jgi:hypothetical protein
MWRADEASGDFLEHGSSFWRPPFFTRILLRTIKEAWHTSDATEPRGSAARQRGHKHSPGRGRVNTPWNTLNGIFDIVDRTHRRHGAFGSITCSSRIGR